MFRIPEIFKPFEKVIAAESNRHGGVSSAPYESLNLGLSTGDVSEKVLENRRLFFGALGIDIAAVAISHQVHEDKILLASIPGNYTGYDAIITQTKNLFVAVSTADCVPILIYDCVHQAVAAIHAGWPGTSKAIVYKSLVRMREEFGTKGADCFVSIGTCIDEFAYEVGEEVADLFSENHKTFYPGKNKFHLKLKAANMSQLTDFGILHENVEISAYCTYTNNDQFFSHRKEKGHTGRMISVIGIRN